MSQNTQMKTSIFPDDQTELVKHGQFQMPSLALVSFLVVCFFVFKAFIYIKDGKRHGK